MNELLERFRRLTRDELQRELRRIIGDEKVYLWENIGYNWHYREVRAGPVVAAKTGTRVGEVMGYHVSAGHVLGGAMGDLMNVEPQERPPFPDPFAA